MPLNSIRRDGYLQNNIKQFLKPYFKFNKNRTIEPLESWTFIVHYKFTVGMFTCLFVSIAGCWFGTAPMECILKYDRRIPDEWEEELCLSYPYTYNDRKERVYALHYKWVHWAILILIPLYCIPLQLKKHLEIEDLNSYLYYIEKVDKKDPNRRTCISNIVDRYIGFCTGNLYHDKMLILFVTLFVDVIGIFFVDIALQNRFLRLIPLDYPFTRWPQFFNDTMSLAFPPFAECKIGKEQLLLNEMEETFGCNLNLMRIYDKMFVVMWVYMSLITILTLTSIVYYLTLGISSYHQKNLIKRKDCDQDVEICLKYLSLGDLMLLRCLGSVLNTEENKEVLKKLATKLMGFEKTGSALQ